MESSSKVALATSLIEKISTRNFDIEQLYADYHDCWSEFYLDELALVVTDEIIRPLQLFDEYLHSTILENSYLFDSSGLHTLLLHSWLPKLNAVLAQQWPSKERQVFAILNDNEYTKTIHSEIKDLILPYVKELDDACHWAVYLDCDLADTIDLLQEKICESAPEIPDDISHVRNFDKVLLTCLKVWSPAANAHQLATINIERWGDFGLGESDICGIFAAALSCKWPLPQLVSRYNVVKELSVVIQMPTKELEMAKLYSLNLINASLDRSGALPKFDMPIVQVSLEQVLMDWCAENNVDAKGDPSDRRKYHLKTGSSYMVVEISDNIFWVKGKPIELDLLRKYLF